ncbi:hypothetical protein [Oricola sp.]|uniref:hypothetical protein n=1 Tax=Oricola sp. TaxID=1979950 RepID=UPI0025DA648E|nr:hypothetical protein [Oricola sp.]MCI5076716.1 hypothetical protein [Oricola sp.]
MFTSFRRLALAVLIALAPLAAAADTLDDWNRQFTHDVQSYNQKTFTRSIRGREYTLSGVISRVRAAWKTLTNSARNLENELGRVTKPPRRNSGYILVPGSNSAVTVSQ